MIKKKSLLSGTMAAIATIGLLTNFVTPASAQDGQLKYSADIPQYITTPDKVETRIGTLNFHDGASDDKTVKKVSFHYADTE